MDGRSIRQLATDVGFGEGPVVTTAGEIVITSIDQGRLYIVRVDGAVEVLAELGGGPNGATADLNDDIFVAQNGGNWAVGRERGLTPETFDPAGVQKVSLVDGSVEFVSNAPLAPNDLCFGPDGLLYVTDPTRERAFNEGRIWSVDPASGVATMLYEVDWYTNGIGFALEDDVMYVASTRAQQIVALPTDPSTGSKGEVVVQMRRGQPDGFTFDAEGNIVIAAIGENPGDPGSVQTWSLKGEQLDEFNPGPSKHYTNVTLGADRTLILTDSDAGLLLAIDDWPTAGLALHPVRQKDRLAPALAPGLAKPN